MNICGIIAEYNPFHNGHKHHIEQSRLLGATHIVCAMSASFTQRGEVAIMDKWTRADIAVQNGADLVVELPVRYSLASANTFARAGVDILNELGVDTISFGSECGDIAALKKLADAIGDVQNSPVLTAHVREGKSYPRALQATIESTCGSELAELLLSPNNALGIEYLNAIKNTGITPVTIKREQVDHDSDITSETMASASHIRALIATLNIPYNFMPQNAQALLKKLHEQGEFPVLQSTLEPMIMYKLKSMSAAEFSALPDVVEGLHNRLFRAAQTATKLPEFYSLVKTKRYTLARIRRIAHCALLGVTSEVQNAPIECVRVLAANERGFEVIKNAQGASNSDFKLPISANFKTLFSCCEQSLKTDIFATDIFSLAKPVPKKSGEDFFHQLSKGK